METIGFLGLGNMGQGMAKNVQKAGYPMVVLDPRKEQEKDLVTQGAKSAKTPAELAKLCDIIVTMLPGPVEVEEVALGKEGLIHGMKPGSILIDMSTSRPSLIRKIAVEFEKKGLHACDAPVSGGIHGANTGALSIMFGGEKEILDKVQPLLKCMGNRVLNCGKVGAGCVCKAAHNMFLMMATQCLAEAFTMGVKAGVEPKAIFDAIRNGGMGRNAVLHDQLPRTIFQDKLEPPLFSIALATKDLKIATETGREYKVPMPVANLVEQFFVEAVNRGWSGKDLTSIFLLQEEASGVKVRIPDIDVVACSKLVIFNPEVR